MSNKIGWCDITLNPVVGCEYGCEYCYARRMAYRQRKNCQLCYEFIVHEHLDRLNKLNPKQKPKKIFIDSMWDWNSPRVKKEWIEKILTKMRECPQHTFQILSKKPELYKRYKYPKNVWIGTSITKNGDENRIIHLYKLPLKTITFLSIEPLLEEMNINYDVVDWIIVGAETGNRKGKIIPGRKWIVKLVDQAEDYNIPVFMKESLRKIWGKPLIQEFPSRS